MAQIEKFVPTKGALLRLAKEWIFTKNLKYLTNVIQMFFPWLAEYQDIIQEHDDKLSESSVHYWLERCWCITETKPHDFELVMPQECVYRGLRTILLTNTYLIISWMQVKFCKVCGSLDSVKEIVDIWQTCLVLNGNPIQVSPITDQTKKPVLFFDKENKCSKRRLAGLYKSSF